LAIIAATATTTAAVPSIPVLRVSTPISPKTLSNWAVMKAGERVSRPCTPTVFWAVTAVRTLMP